jgi:hypothetical protein
MYILYILGKVESLYAVHCGLFLIATGLPLHRTTADSILSLVFKMEKVIEVNPYSLSLLLNDMLLT